MSKFPLFLVKYAPGTPLTFHTVYFGTPRIEVVVTAIFVCCPVKQSDYSPMKWSQALNGKEAMKSMEV